jgi:hypothetical protein
MIRPGEQVLVSKLPAEQINIGDVMLFRRGSDLILHRVLKKWRTDSRIHFKEKGDASLTCGQVDVDNVVGKIIIMRRGGKILCFNTPFSRLTSFALGVWLYWTVAFIGVFSSPTGSEIVLIKKILTRLLLVVSNILVRFCCIIWYLSGLFSRKDVEFTS